MQEDAPHLRARGGLLLCGQRAATMTRHCGTLEDRKEALKSSVRVARIRRGPSRGAVRDAHRLQPSRARHPAH
eukprot:4587907-Alexandrium_andersonii.AAC.1